jgi:hypothetical protein
LSHGFIFVIDSFLRFFELIDQGRGRVEIRTHAFTAGGQSQCDRQVGFPCAGLAEQADIGVLRDPL